MTDKLAATDHAAGETPLPIETDQTRAAEALQAQASGEERESDLQDMRGEFARRILQNGSLVFVDGVEYVLFPKDTARPVPPDPELRLAPLFAALAVAQGAFPEIPKNRIAKIRPQSGTTFEFKYSDLSDLIKATRPALTANGLAVFQVPSDDLKTCITTLAHSTGLVLVGNYPVRHKDGRMHPGQDWAISWAFARRYGMSALLGIASEETVEGDRSENTREDFQSGGGDGILSVRGVVVPPGATKPEKAKLFASAIEGKLDEAATETGLEGVWSRNLDVINTFQDHYPALHQNLLDVYQRCLNSIREGEG